MYYIDMHCDTITRLLKDADQGKSSSLRKNDLHIDLNRMKQANYLLQNFAVFTPLGHVDDPMEFALRAIDKYYEEIDRNKDIIRPVYCYDDMDL